MESHKKYLGDAVYAHFDGYHIVLTVEYGMEHPAQIIALEPEVIINFTKYLAELPVKIKDNG